MGSKSSKAGEGEAPPKPPPKPRKSKMFNESSLVKDDAPVKPSKPVPAPLKPPAAAVPAKKDPVPPLSSQENRSVKSMSISLKPKAKAKQINPAPGDGNGEGRHCVTVLCAMQAQDKEGQDYYQYQIQINVKSGRKLVLHRYNIARRCNELQQYLRDVSKVSALLYSLGKFLGGLDEQELKDALKSGHISGGNGPSVDLARVSSGNTTALPKVKLVERESGSNGGVQFEAVPSGKVKEQPKRVVEVAVKEVPKEVPKAKEVPKEVPKAKEVVVKEVPKTIVKEAPKVATETVKEAPKTAAAAAAPTTGLSVKERMAAFQKAKN
ncbi:hypothetical protein BASA81_016513 [Batrachochytrium salamandrivorans]|nr:hypothetical protein BASA81_016513 [Batrachochytrium salamandrivorans]